MSTISFKSPRHYSAKEGDEGQESGVEGETMHGKDSTCTLQQDGSIEIALMRCSDAKNVPKLIPFRLCETNFFDERRAGSSWSLSESDMAQ